MVKCEADHDLVGPGGKKTQPVGGTSCRVDRRAFFVFYPLTDEILSGWTLDNRHRACGRALDHHARLVPGLCIEACAQGGMLLSKYSPGAHQRSLVDSGHLDPVAENIVVDGYLRVEPAVIDHANLELGGRPRIQ